METTVNILPQAITLEYLTTGETPKLWNILPQAIRDADSLFLFKKKLKDYFLGLYI